MASTTVVPLNLQTFEDKAGNYYLIFDVNHDGTNNTDSYVSVPDSAIACAELASAVDAAPTNTAVAGSGVIDVDSSANQIAIVNVVAGDSVDSGQSWGNYKLGDGVRQLKIDRDTVAGTYRFVVRCIGNAGGTGAGNSQDL